MKRQLSTLQQLIGIMDPELYAHLGQPSFIDRSQKRKQLIWESHL